MPEAPWTEDDLGAEVSIRFDGRNAEVIEAMEVAQFAQGVKTPAEEDPGGAQFVRGRYQNRVMTPMRAVSLGLAFGLLVLGQLVLDAVDVTNAVLRSAAALATWLLGFGAISLVLHFLRRPEAPKATRTAEESFVLTFRPGVFEVRGSQGTSMSVPLADIRGFENRVKRIHIVRRDGSISRLPCLLLAGRPEVLASRLSDLALAQGAAYRGSQ